MSFKVKIEYTNENCKLEKHGNCYDVKAAKDINFQKNNKAMIPLGFKTEMHKALRASLYPRSSSFKNWGFIQTNSIGEIEPDFGGEWNLPVYFLTQGALKDIKEGDRIAQVRFSIREDASWWDKIKSLFTKIEVIESKVNSTRQGFGSTGK